MTRFKLQTCSCAILMFQMEPQQLYKLIQLSGEHLNYHVHTKNKDFNIYEELNNLVKRSQAFVLIQLVLGDEIRFKGFSNRFLVCGHRPKTLRIT